MQAPEHRARLFPGSDKDAPWLPPEQLPPKDDPMGQEEWDEEEYLREQQELLARQEAFERMTQARMATKGAGKRPPVGPYEGKSGGKSGPQPPNTNVSFMVNSFKGVPVSYGPLNPAPGQSSDSMDTKDAPKRTAQDKETDC